MVFLELMNNTCTDNTIKKNRVETQLIETANGTWDYGSTLQSIIASQIDTSDVSQIHWLFGAGTSHYSHESRLSGGAYVSKGGTAPVHFDNILVKRIQGKIRQFNHYYPYSLSISGVNGVNGSYKNMYTSKEIQNGEFASGRGLEMYDFDARFEAGPERSRRDPQLGRWFAPDPAEQFHNPYLAMGNNPVMYVDPNGEFVWAIPIAIGAAMNVVGNWDHISNAGNFWDGVGLAAGYAGVGALQGAATLICGRGGFALGGAIGGLGNGLIQGQSGAALAQSAAVGAAAGLFGGAVAQGATGALGSFASPLLTGVTHGAVGGVAGGAVGGFVAGGLMGGNPWKRHGQEQSQVYFMVLLLGEFRQVPKLFQCALIQLQVKI